VLYHALATVAQPPAQVFDVLELHPPVAVPQVGPDPGLQGTPTSTVQGTAYGVVNFLPAGMPHEVPLEAVSKAQELDLSSTAENASTPAICTPTVAAFVAAIASCMTLASCAAVGWQWRPRKLRRYAAVPSTPNGSRTRADVKPTSPSGQTATRFDNAAHGRGCAWAGTL